MEKRELLRRLRSETGMSQRRFAAYFRIPIRTYEDWERGVRKMPEYLLRLMAYKLWIKGMIACIPEQLAEETEDE